MKGFFAAVFFVLASSLINTSALAQVAPTGGDTVGPPQPVPTTTNYRPLVLPEPANTIAGGNRPPREARVLKTGVLAPSTADRAALAGFLRTPNTGLIRLLPREIYGRVYQNGKMVMGNGGAYYSFSYLSHYYGYGSDIQLEANLLSVGFAGCDYGMLTKLGDVALDTITASDPRAEFISRYKPAAKEQQARAEFRRFGIREGVTIDGAVYSRRLPAEEDTTYLLRSIVYDRSDVLVAFRVVRKDTDGSVIIAWKLLKNYGAPGLISGK